MTLNIENLKSQIAQQWVDAMSINDLIGYYLEKTEEFLNQQSEEAIISFALDCEVITEDELTENKG